MLQLIRQLLILLVIASPSTLSGRTIQPFYEDPFDIGAGGTVLTWATQESILINNPALLPHGGTFLRWIGLKLNLSPGLDSLVFAQNLLGSGAEGGGEQSEEGNSDSPLAILSNFETPVHVGASSALSMITNNGGGTVYLSTEPDIRYWEKGDPELGTGIPNVVIRSETYGGAHLASAAKTWDWLSFGASLKVLQISETTEKVELTDREGINQLQNTFSNLSNTSLEAGVGLDGGSLLFFQGQFIDLRLAVTASNIGNLQLNSGRILPQMLHGGIGLTLHTDSDALHFSAELRDVTRAYAEEPDYKRLHLGTRLLLRTYVGLSAGIYQGSPTYGLELDLIFFRLAATYYTREYSVSPGVDPRKVIIISYSQGFSF